MFRQIFCIAITLAFAVGLQACSKLDSAGSSKTGQPTSNSAESNYQNRSVEYPADFPLPQYPGSRIEGTRLKPGKVNSLTVLLVSEDKVKGVFDFYAKNYKDDGWDVGKVIKENSYMMITARKSGRESNVMISETRSGNTAISLLAIKK